MRKKAHGYAHLLVQVEFDADPEKDERQQALEALNEQAKKEYGLYPSDFEFTEGIEVYDKQLPQ